MTPSRYSIRSTKGVVNRKTNNRTKQKHHHKYLVKIVAESLETQEGKFISNGLIDWH